MFKSYLQMKFLDEHNEGSDLSGGGQGTMEPPEGAAPPEPASPPSDEGEDSFTLDDVEKLMAYNPFPEEPEEPVAPEPKAPADGLEGKAPVEPATPEPPAKTPKEPQGELETLRAQLQEAQAKLAEVTAPAEPAAPAQPAQPQGAKTPLDILGVTQEQLYQHYAWEFPKELSAKLVSEDDGERLQGMQQLLQGVAAAIHQSVLGQSYELQQRQVPEMLQHHTREAEYRREVFNDFYGKFKDLNKKELYPVVQQAAKMVMQANPGAQWNEQTQNLVAAQARMQAALMGHQFKPPAPPAATPTPHHPTTKSSAAPSGTRPPMNNGQDPGDFILSVLDPF